MPGRPTLTITGAVERRADVDLSELERLPRVDTMSDLHCVTTWTATGLRWSGVSFRDFYEQVVVPQCRPAGDARAFVLVGLDGYRVTVDLEDALATGVLLADRLDGRPLPPEHGAPLRYVSPAQYGYKSAKHLCGIEVWTQALPSALGAKEHPRARVWLEERHARLPGRILRGPYRVVVPLTAWGNARAARDPVGTDRMTRTALVLGGGFSAAVALGHLGVIAVGADAYRYFGAGERIARAAERGSPLPAVLTATIAALLGAAGAYAFSGAGLIRRLPQRRRTLAVIAAVYGLRGSATVVQLPLTLVAPSRFPPRELVFSTMSLAAGALHLVGLEGLVQRNARSRGS